MGEYSALKEAIDISMAKIKAAKNAIKDAINTAGDPMGVSVDDTDTFRSYADAIKLMYQRIWSSDDDTDAPAKCIITNDDFPAAPMHNYGYIDINDLSASRFTDANKYYAASSFIVNIQNPPVPIGSKDNYFIGKIVSIEHSSEPDGDYTGTLPPENYGLVRSYLAGEPVYPLDREIGKYIAFFTGCWTAQDPYEYTSEVDYIDFPGGLYMSYFGGTTWPTGSGGINSTVTIAAYDRDNGTVNETFKYLGRWHGKNVGIWQRLTGGD